VDSPWINITTDNIWKCTDATTGAAVWKKLNGLPVYRQDSEPTLSANDEQAIWYDTSVNDQAWLIFRVAEGDQRKMEMT